MVSKHLQTDDKMNLTQMLKLVLGLKNIVEIGENAGYQHFLLFPQCFQRAFLLGLIKSRDCVVKS